MIHIKNIVILFVALYCALLTTGGAALLYFIEFYTTSMCICLYLASQMSSVTEVKKTYGFIKHWWINLLFLLSCYYKQRKEVKT